MAARLWERIEVDPVTGCWLWTGATTEGYGVMGGPNRTTVKVHREVYKLLVGPIPDGKRLDHTCHNDDEACAGGTSCLHRRWCNPFHLVPATDQENILRGKGPTAEYARMEVCHKGHPFRDRRNRRGSRVCLECKAERARRYARQGRVS